MIKDEKYYNSAVKRAKKCGIEDIDRYGIIIFLEKEIEQYRKKINMLEKAIKDSNKLKMYFKEEAEKAYTYIDKLTERNNEAVEKLIELAFALKIPGGLKNGN